MAKDSQPLDDKGFEKLIAAMRRMYDRLSDGSEARQMREGLFSKVPRVKETKCSKPVEDKTP